MSDRSRLGCRTAASPSARRLLGAPLRPDCPDDRCPVAWNTLAPDLWRPTIGLRRARLVGLTAAHCARRVCASYVKVAEYRQRGAVHDHAVIGVDTAGGDSTPPSARATVGLLAAAMRQAAASVRVPGPALDGEPVRVGWGEQLSIRPIGGGVGELSAGGMAGYLAKYATTATGGLGAALDQPVASAAELDSLLLPEQVAWPVRACWTVGATPGGANIRLRRWAHMLGCGGHCTTKSRHYSTTMRALRAARRYHGPAVQLDPDVRILPPAGAVAVAGWQYAGRGCKTPADAREARCLAREEPSGVA